MKIKLLISIIKHKEIEKKIKIVANVMRNERLQLKKHKKKLCENLQKHSHTNAFKKTDNIKLHN